MGQRLERTARSLAPSPPPTRINSGSKPTETITASSGSCLITASWSRTGPTGLLRWRRLGRRGYRSRSSLSFRKKTCPLRVSEEPFSMPFELTFSDAIPYPDNDGGILLYVVLSRAGLRATAEAVVDSGGSVCLFSRELGVSLGLDVETGIPKRLDS